jgi:hypothetical protein
MEIVSMESFDLEDLVRMDALFAVGMGVVIFWVWVWIEDADTPSFSCSFLISLHWVGCWLVSIDDGVRSYGGEVTRGEMMGTAMWALLNRNKLLKPFCELCV